VYDNHQIARSVLKRAPTEWSSLLNNATYASRTQQAVFESKEANRRLKTLRSAGCSSCGAPTQRYFCTTPFNFIYFNCSTNCLEHACWTPIHKWGRTLVHKWSLCRWPCIRAHISRILYYGLLDNIEFVGYLHVPFYYIDSSFSVARWIDFLDAASWPKQKCEQIPQELTQTLVLLVKKTQQWKHLHSFTRQCLGWEKKHLEILLRTCTNSCMLSLSKMAAQAQALFLQKFDRESSTMAAVSSWAPRCQTKVTSGSGARLPRGRPSSYLQEHSRGIEQVEVLSFIVYRLSSEPDLHLHEQ